MSARNTNNAETVENNILVLRINPYLRSIGRSQIL